MADEKTQGTEDTSWWTSRAAVDAPKPPLAFDEPLVWPEALDWEHPPGNGASPPPDPPPGVDGDAVPVPFPVSEIDSERPQAPDMHPIADEDPLAGLGGGTVLPPAASRAMPPPPPDELDDLPTLVVAGGWPDGDPPAGDALQLGSVWADVERSAAGNLLVTSSLAVPSVSANAYGNSGGRSWDRLKVRPGNAAIIALISVASLVLLGMFLSVRARNDAPTSAFQTRPPTTDISVPGPLRTIPPITAVTTTVPSPSINLSDLLPTPDSSVAAGAAGAGASVAGPSGGTGAAAARPTGVDGGVGSGETATTAPTRAAPSTGAGTTTTQPAPQSTPTTAAPEPEPTTTVPPVEDTRPPTVTTRPPVSTPPFTIPDINVPSFPSTPQRTIPRFPGRDD